MASDFSRATASREPTLADPFLDRLQALCKPIDGWGEFLQGARPAAVAFILYRQAGERMGPVRRRRADLFDHPAPDRPPRGGGHPGAFGCRAAAPSGAGG